MKSTILNGGNVPLSANGGHGGSGGYVAPNTPEGAIVLAEGEEMDDGRELEEIPLDAVDDLELERLKIVENELDDDLFDDLPELMDFDDERNNLNSYYFNLLLMGAAEFRPEEMAASFVPYCSLFLRQVWYRNCNYILYILITGLHQ